MNPFNLTELKDNLNLAIFSISRYFQETEKGCYLIDSVTFENIISHPMGLTYYQRRCALQQGRNFVDIDPVKYYTCFNSVSQFHLEFDSGVVLVRDVQ